MTSDAIEELKGTRFNINPVRSSSEEINWVLENVSVNIFAILTDNFARFGHNLFIQVQEDASGKESFGPFIFIDNDRSRWRFSLRAHPKSKVPANPSDHPLAHFCKFPKDLAHRLLLLNSLRLEGLSLGKLVMLSTAVYGDLPSGPIFQQNQAVVLDAYVSYVATIIQRCLDRNPIEEVLFDEPGREGQYDFLESIVDLNTNAPKNASFSFIPEFLQNADLLGFLS